VSTLRRENQQKRLAESQPNLSSRILFRVRQHWKWLLGFIGVPGLLDLLKEHLRVKAMDWLFSKLGTVGTWVRNYPPALFSLGLAAALLWLASAAIRESLITSDSPILNHEGNPYQLKRLSAGWTAIFVVVVLACLSFLAYGGYVWSTARTVHTAAPGTLACQVASVQLDSFYRFFQDPPVYFQRLDTALRLSLTNGVGRRVYLRNYSVAALTLTEWVPFKNADSAAFEPNAFGLMGVGESQAYLGRFDLSANGFDYVMQQKPLEPDENIELWMFFISGLSRERLREISQFKFIFHERAGAEELSCISPYSVKDDQGAVIGMRRGNLKAKPLERIPPNLREEPAH
jgi:hypothetical protein